MSQEHFDTIIVGAGVVGSALAAFLSEDSADEKILLIDRSFDVLAGSTGYAPGLVGQFNTSQVLTMLAQASVNEYASIPGAFLKVGCLELASSEEGCSQQLERLQKAKERGISAEFLAHEEALKRMLPFVKTDSFQQALYFPDDGVADPRVITQAYRTKAKLQSVHFEEADVVDIRRSEYNVTGVSTADGRVFHAARVVLAGGIWTTQLLLTSMQKLIPLVPVAHPYVYSDLRPKRESEHPFVRWPERHVYARDHGDRDGFGTYDHRPFPVDKPGASAINDWTQSGFDQAISKALSQCISSAFGAHAKRDSSEGCPGNRVREKVSGIFAVTPDNLPFVGPLGPDGLWIAAGIWVTTAAGSAKFLTRLLNDGEVDDKIRTALDPNRFGSKRTMDMLRREALGTYNDIYAAEENGMSA